MNRPSIDEMYHDPALAFQALRDEMRKSARVCFPGIIHAFNPAMQTASIQPAITDSLRSESGTELVRLPLMQDVPVYCPGGGGYAITMPIKPGDECLVMVADSCIDAWFQSGGVQNPMVLRARSLSDAFAFVGFRSRPNALCAYNMDQPEMNGDPALWGGRETIYPINGIVPVDGAYALNAANIPAANRGDVQAALDALGEAMAQARAMAAASSAALGGLTFAINAYDHGLDITYTEQEEG